MVGEDFSKVNSLITAGKLPVKRIVIEQVFSWGTAWIILDYVVHEGRTYLVRTGE